MMAISQFVIVQNKQATPPETQHNNQKKEDDRRQPQFTLDSCDWITKWWWFLEAVLTAKHISFCFMIWKTETAF